LLAGLVVLASPLIPGLALLLCLDLSTALSVASLLADRFLLVLSTRVLTPSPLAALLYSPLSLRLSLLALSALTPLTAVLLLLSLLARSALLAALL